MDPAAGMAVLEAFIRGLARWNARTIGNFWVDLTRTTLHILLPLSLVLALVLVSQGVVQTLAPSQTVSLVEAGPGRGSIALGSVASQIAIKQIGTLFLTAVVTYCWHGCVTRSNHLRSRQSDDCFWRR